MGQGVRVIGPDRAQLRWDMVDLDSQRLLWVTAFAGTTNDTR
jgi:hypothetical protein